MEEFLQVKHNYPPADSTSKPNSYRKSMVRAVKALSEMLKSGKLPDSMLKYRKQEWAFGDIEIINGFMEKHRKTKLSEATKLTRMQALERFYRFLKVKEITSISELTPEIISDYVLELQGYSSGYSLVVLSALKLYLRFAFENGCITENLELSVPKVMAHRNRNVTALWSKEEVVQLLKSIDRGSPCGKRDYAILLLISQLGLRASDIASLKLENFKWERKELDLSQHKTGTRVTLPLTQEVGWAVIDYLRYGRPKVESDFVFLTHFAPITPFASGSTVNGILRRAMRVSGLRKEAPCTMSGVHSLRHNLARRLVADGVPLKTIIDIMGHTDPSSTAPYSRVDIEGLRDCSLVPDWLVECNPRTCPAYAKARI